MPSENFYPRPPRGGRREDVLERFREQLISIHALREEGDILSTSIWRPATYFYPRPPRGGRRGGHGKAGGQCDFYPRPPRGGRPVDVTVRNKHLDISIHALREEGDVRSARCGMALLLFLSTPSARRATHYSRTAIGYRLISIHALREEGDVLHIPRNYQNDLFLSTPSARRATCSKTTLVLPLIFLSTPSARRATLVRRPMYLLEG